MHPAVDLLLKRMESNPEEFVSPHQRERRWEVLISKYESHMKNEERIAIKEKYSELQMNKCHKEIMAELLREPQPEKERPEKEMWKQVALPFDARNTNTIQGTVSGRNIREELEKFVSDKIKELNK